MKKWARALYQPNLPLEENHRVTACEEHIRLSKEAATEGMVLLKNEKNLLPLAKGTRLALFGKGTFDYVKGGGGSGDVTVSYIRNLYEGLKMQTGIVDIYEPLADYYRENVHHQYEQGTAPGMTVEPLLPEGLLKGAKAFADTAVIVISRFSGEGWDRSGIECRDEDDELPQGELTMPKISQQVFPDGDFYLTENEKKMICQVETTFDKIAVVLNVGGIVDTTWIKENDQISSALLGWQGGMEGGLAMAEILCGKVNPSGKLTDTFARRAEDYPSMETFHESFYYVDYTEDIYVGYRYFETIPGAAAKVIYPFGYGLSYTDFEVQTEQTEEREGRILIYVRVTNTGKRAGKEVVQVYFQAPQGLLKKPFRQLITFEKTRLLQAGESQILKLSFKADEMASYDDLGKIRKSAWVLEKGTYEFYVGTSVRDTEKTTYSWEQKEDKVTKQLMAKLVPSNLKKRMLSDGTYEALPLMEANDPNACVFEKMHPGSEEGLTPVIRAWERRKLWGVRKEEPKQFIQVAEGTLTMDEFINQLTEEDLLELLGGQPNTGVANTFGFGNLPGYGVPNIMTADGPAGLRIAPECGICTTAWPCATLLACTWNPEIVYEVGAAGAKEVRENNIAVWLTPAINIHRTPMCGRNFEYYSEDPYLVAKQAGAMVRGIQSQHIAATVKHFALNNKETNRKDSNSRVSERAARQIYLKTFERIVKEAKPWCIMSSYNIVNDYRASENHDLLEKILRDEWGFEGVVMTDWWTFGEHCKEVNAGNDVKMAAGNPDNLLKALEKGLLKRETMECSVKRLLGVLLKID